MLQQKSLDGRLLALSSIGHSSPMVKLRCEWDRKESLGSSKVNTAGFRKWCQRKKIVIKQRENKQK